MDHVIYKSFGISKEEKACINCKYYHQHYIKVDTQSYIKCYDGHCTNPRLKSRKPSQSCEHFEFRE